MLYITAVVYLNSNYFLPVWLTQHYTQLAKYHLPKFEGGISKEAKKRQSAALLLVENAQYPKQVFEVWFKLQNKNVWQKSSWNSLKILWANFIKLFNHLIAFASLHRPWCFTLPSSVTCSVSEFVVKNIRKHVLFFWIFLYRRSFLTKPTDSCSFLLKRYLVVVPSLLFHHACLLLVKKLTISRYAITPWMKPLLLLLTKSPNARKFCSSICFFRFRFLAYWGDYCKFAWFDSLKPLK